MSKNRVSLYRYTLSVLDVAAIFWLPFKTNKASIYFIRISSQHLISEAKRYTNP